MLDELARVDPALEVGVGEEVIVDAVGLAGPTKRVEASVWRTRTAWPARIASRTSSTVLYAAIPPLTPSRIRAMA